jgi:hypothetical protein
MSIYDPLYKLLSLKSAGGIGTVPATFKQIESVLGFALPDTARSNPQWWGNETGDSRHAQCRAWLNAGFETRNLSLSKEYVEFVERDPLA